MIHEVQRNTVPPKEGERKQRKRRVRIPLSARAVVNPKTLKNGAPNSISVETIEQPELVEYEFDTTRDHVTALQGDPLGQTRKDLILTGMKPQLAVAELTYLVKASVLAGRPMSLQIRGESEAGKSTMLSTVLKMHPTENLTQAMHITFAALMNGAGQGGDFRRQVIAFDEAIEGRKKDAILMAAIRELSTKERVLRYKEGSGGTQEIELLGPATVIDAMLTDTTLAYQDASRFLVVKVNEDAETREAICRLNWERYQQIGLKRQASLKKIADAHRIFLKGLRDDLTIFIPSWLKPTYVSARFDSAICSLVCAAAWLNQNNRSVGEDNTLEVTLADYAWVWNLLRSVCVLAPQSELSDSASRILVAWQKHVRSRGNMSVTIPELHDVCKSTMDFGAFSRLVKVLRDDGYASIISKGTRGQHNLQLTTVGESYSGCDLVAALPLPALLEQAQRCAASRNSQSPFNEQVTTGLEQTGRKNNE